MSGRARAALALLLCFSASLGACGRRAPRAAVVRASNFAFAPVTLDVAVGDTLVFTNADIVPHTTTALDGAWDSNTIATAATWRVVARVAGRHEYVCTFHPTMKGTVTVR